MLVFDKAGVGITLPLSASTVLQDFEYSSSLEGLEMADETWDLVALGILSDEDAMGARLGVAVIASPDPDAKGDVLRSRLEMTQEGHILANGQRVQ